MLHARDALIQAYKEQAEKYPAALQKPGVRAVLSVVLMALGHDEDQQVKSWDDVSGVFKEATEAHLPSDLKPVQPQFEALFSKVIDAARRIAPVYISPPPIE